MVNKYEMFCLSLSEPLNEIVQKSIKKDRTEFESGYLCALHRVITLMQQQAEIFDISFDVLGINIDEKELI